MDKDLQNHLNWLGDELLDEEDLTGLDFSLDDILSEFSEEAPSPARNRARDFDRMAFDDESFSESTAVLVSKKKNKAPREAPRKKGIRGLVIVAILEVIAIVAVLLRWALWFL